MVECNGLENRRWLIPNREFESLLLRHFFPCQEKEQAAKLVKDVASILIVSSVSQAAGLVKDIARIWVVSSVG